MQHLDSLSNNIEKRLDLDILGHFSYKKIIIAGISIGVLSAIVISGILFSSHYSDKFYPNLSIEGVKVSGQTTDQIKPILEEKVESLLNTTISIKIDDKNTENFTYKDLGATYNIDTVMNETWQIGHQKSFKSQINTLKTVFKRQNFALTPTLDNAKFKKNIEDLATRFNQPAKNATLQVDNGKISLIPAQDGKLLVIIDLGNELNEIILKRAQNASAKFEVAKPQISDTDVNEAKEQAENWLSQPIILVFEDSNYSAGINEISKWIKFTENGNKLKAELDTNKITEFIDNLATKINSSPKNKVIDGASGQVIDEGKDGKSLEKESTVNAIVEILNKNLAREISLDVKAIPKSEKTVYADYTLGQYPNKYIEVDLGHQKLYQIEGNTLINTYTVSSGKYSMPTPTGTFSILEKNPKAFSATYQVYMPWWMAFIGSKYGLHALPEWPNGAREGESHLGTPVSHGCVRLGDDAAKALYDWAEIGTPLVVHQ